MRPTIPMIIRAVSTAARLPVESIVSPARDRSLFIPRLAIYVIARGHAYSLTQIGNRVKRDHTSVMVALRRAEQFSADVNPLIELANQIIASSNATVIANPGMASTDCRLVVAAVGAVMNMPVERIQAQKVRDLDITRRLCRGLVAKIIIEEGGHIWLAATALGIKASHASKAISRFDRMVAERHPRAIYALGCMEEIRVVLAKMRAEAAERTERHATSVALRELATRKTQQQVQTRRHGIVDSFGQIICNP